MQLTRWKHRSTTGNCRGDHLLLAADGYRTAGTLTVHCASDRLRPCRGVDPNASCHHPRGHASSAGRPSYDPCRDLRDHRDHVRDRRTHRSGADHRGLPGTHHVADQTCPFCVCVCRTELPEGSKFNGFLVFPRVRETAPIKLIALWSLAVTFLGANLELNSGPRRWTRTDW